MALQASSRSLHIPGLNFRATPIIFDAITVAFASIYFVFTLLYLDYLPLTKSEAAYFFTAPIRNQYTLFYLLLKSLTGVFFALFFLGYSAFSFMPQLLGFTTAEVARVIIALFVSMAMCLALGLMLLALKYKYPTGFSIFRYAILFAGALALTRVSFIIYEFVSGLSGVTGPNLNILLGRIVGFLTSKPFYYTPFLGFVLMANKFVYNPNDFLGILALVASTGFCIFVAFKLDFSMATKAFDIATKFEKMRARKRGEGKALPEFFSTKYIDQSKQIKGYGAQALISKYMIEYLRNNNILLTSKNILFLGINILIIIIFIITTKGLPNPQTRFDDASPSLIVITMLNYILALIPDKIAEEMNLPIMQTLPVSNIKKMSAQFFYNAIPNFLQAILIFIFFMVYGNSIFECALYTLIMVLALFACTSVDFLFTTIFNDKALTTYRLIFSIFIKVFIWLGLFFAIVFNSSLPSSQVFFSSITFLAILGIYSFIIVIGLALSVVVMENR
jgi:hypothetical protein